MAILRFNNVGMTAIAGCVPANVLKNRDLKDFMPEEEVEKLVNAIGIEERRVTYEGTTASDLCFKAAEKLLADNEIDKNTIDLILFLSQAADYVTPPTSCILQHRLGLPESCAAIDLTMACSGFIYALSTAYAYFSSPTVNRILVCVGETMTKLTNPRDRVNYPLYGDAGTACLVERGDFAESTFLLTSDGAGEKSVYVPCRGFRNPLTAESLEYKEDQDGNFRRDIDITMDGIDTFNHAIKVIPKQVKELMAECNITQEDVDYFVSHQANMLMINFILKRLKFDVGKAPFCLGKFGNTSSASIPLTIVSELCGKMEGKKRVLMSGIGAGWSYATCYLNTVDLKVSPLIEY